MTIYKYLVLVVFLCVAPLTHVTHAKSGKISGGMEIEFPSWLKESFLDIKEDVSDAKDSGKHVILFFHLNGCPYCAMMMKESFIESSYTKYIQDNFDLIEINIKGSREVALDEDTTIDEKALAQKLKVFSTPTILFLDNEAKVKLRIDGYRNKDDFKRALDFIKNHHYKKMSFHAYLNQAERTAVYKLKDSPHFSKSRDLSALNDKPLVVLFEDEFCQSCAKFHDKILSNPLISKELAKMHIVRLGTGSDEKITDVAGNKTTAAKYAEKLDMHYRPGMVFFNKGSEVARTAGMLKTFHNMIMFRYVAGKHFKQHPNWISYLNIEQKKMLDAGQDIDIWQ